MPSDSDEEPIDEKNISDDSESDEGKIDIDDI